MDSTNQSMYRILIVDDEKNHRKGLINLLQELYPASILLEAADGTEALAVMEYIDCDIIIADIQMTNMNGLELLKHAKRKRPEVEVIILSGYGQFEYAREAMRSNAADYLMKPVDREEIRGILDKIIYKLEAFRENRKQKQSVEDRLTRTMPVYVEHLMNLLIREEEFPEKPEVAKLFSLNKPGYYFLCYVQRLEEREEEEIRQKVKYTIKKCLDPHSSYSFYWDKNKAVLAVCVIADYMPDKKYFDNIIYCINLETGGKSNIYLGKHVPDIYTMSTESFGRAEEVWQYHFFQLNGVVTYEEIRSKMEERCEWTEFDLTGIVKCIKHQDLINAGTLVDAAIEKNRSKFLPNPIIMKQKAAFLLYQLVRSFEMWLSSEYKKEIDNRIDELFQAETISRLKQKMAQFFLQLANELKGFKDKTDSSAKEAMVHCKEYLDKNYMEEISLELTAEKYYFNSSYFSSLFRNTFDITFSDYLIEIRMNKARELLISSGQKVKEIAILVGYRDANYFVRSFKKYYGVTPEEYRKMDKK